MALRRSEEYFFKKDAADLVQELDRKFKALGSFSKSNGLIDKVSKIYNYYYGRMMKTDTKVPGLGVAGESGEFATLNVNHMRNILKHILSIVLQNKLSFDAQAINGDVENRNDANIVNYVLDYYFHEKHLDRECRRAIELAIMGTTGFLGVFWDPKKRVVGVDSEGNAVYTGEAFFRAYDVLSVVAEPFKDRWEDQKWYGIRDIENRFDYIGMYPDQEEAILALPRVQDVQRYDPFMEVNDDAVFIYHAYHKPTPAIPTGRHICYSGDVVFYDMAYEYGEDLNLFCIRPDIVYGSMYGHSPADDLLPIQESITLIDSTIISNQKAFGTQNIATPRQANITVSDLDTGLKNIEYDADPDLPNGGLPQALQLCATPSELFKHRETLKSDMEQVTAINSAIRGMPPTQLTSGTAIALIATQASTYNSVLEESYYSVCADAATMLTRILSMYMPGEQLVAISGKGNSAPVLSYKSKTFSSISRVRIDIGNATSKTLAGRVNLADTMLNNKVINTPEEYMDMVATGKTKQFIEAKTSESQYINMENEMMRQGITPPVVYTDNPMRHILEHRALTFDPTIRNRSDILAIVLKHLTDHMTQLDEMSATNPTLLTLIATGNPVLPQPLPETRVQDANNPAASSAPIQEQGKPADGGAPGSTDAGLAMQDGGSAAAQAGLSSADKVMAQAEAATPA